MNQDRIARRASLLTHLATALLILIPLGVAILLANGGVTAQSVQAHYQISVMPNDPGTGPLLVWCAVEGMKLAVLLWIIWQVRAWLSACAMGAVFTSGTARLVQRIGAALLGLAALHIVGYSVVTVALTWHNPPGQRALAIGFGSTEIILVLAAGLVTLFGWIQAEAARISLENESFV